MFRRTLLLPLLLCTSALAIGQATNFQDVSFEAQFSKERMLLNSTVEYTLTLRNARGTELKPPAFKDWEVLRGPMRNFGTSAFNGVATSYQSYVWQLRPRRTGQLTLGPATVRVNGRTFRSSSRRVEVLPVDATAAAQQPDFLLLAELSDTTAVPGQQLALNLNLYYNGNVISRSITREPSFDGFYPRPLRGFDGRPRSEIRNGKEYQVRTLGSIAVFPAKTGRLPLEPFAVDVGILSYRGDNPFSRRRTEKVRLQTDTLFVDVSDLPRPRPGAFSGGVGRYRMAATLDRREMTADDALTLRLTITGEGDIKRIDDFEPVNPADWTIFPPEVLEEEFLDGPTGLLARKTLEYRLVPRRAGEVMVSPSLTYYDTDSSAYVVRAPEPIPVTVTGEIVATDYTLDTTATTAATRLLTVDALPPGRPYGPGPTGGVGYWLLFLLPLPLAGGAVVLQRYRAARAGRDPAEVARQRAARTAHKRLSAAREHRDRTDARAFYDALEGALLGYLRDRFGLPMADLSRASVRQRLAQTAAAPELADRYDALLQRCEMALYAGQDSADDLAATYAAAEGLIKDTERAVG